MSVLHTVLVVVLAGTMALPIAGSRFADLAHEAGTRVRLAQTSNEELRSLCYADAERTLQDCQEAERENCAGIYEQERRVCLARFPLPRPVDGGPNLLLVFTILIVSGFLLYSYASGGDDAEEF